MKVLRRLLQVVAALLAVIDLALFLVIHTDVGRERVRRLALDAIGGVVHGELHIDRIEGNLLERFTLVGVSIADSSGAQLLAADSLSARLDIRALLQKRLAFGTVEATRLRVQLVQSPDGIWNYERIFPRDSTAVDTTSGFGDWVRMKRVHLTDGSLSVRRPWVAPTLPTPSARDSATAVALSADSRLRVSARGDGYQQRMDFTAIAAEISDVVIADPADDAISMRVDSLAMRATPFNPPSLDIRRLAADIRIAGDSVAVAPLSLLLPGSEATGRLTYRVSSGDVEATLQVPRLALVDIRTLYPPLPDSGGGHMLLTLALRDTAASEYFASDADLTVGVTTLRGALGLVLDDASTRFVRTDLRATRLTSKLVEQLVPGVTLPLAGEVTGRILADGAIEQMQLQLDATVSPRGYRTFGVGARGGLGFANGEITARRLQLNAEGVPLQLARAFDAEVPIGGTINASATVDGSSATRLTGVAHMTHRDGENVSRVDVEGHVAVRDSMRLDLIAQLHEVALALADTFVGRDDIRGTVSGEVHLWGTPRDVATRFALILPDSGLLDGEAGYQSMGERPAYRANVQLHGVEPKTILPTLPETRLDGTVMAEGRGFDPATLDATLDARIAPFMIDSAEVRELVVRAHAADGLATVDSLSAVTAFGSVRASGDIGLTSEHKGKTTFAVAVNDLGGLRRWIATADSGLVEPRPAIAERVARLRAIRDSLAAEQERGNDPATLLAADMAGKNVVRPPPPAGSVVVPPISRDSIAGSFTLEGEATGSVKGVDVTATFETPGIVWGGNLLGAGSLKGAWQGALTENDTLHVTGGVDSVRFAGFAFDSTLVDVRYHAGEGEADVSLFPGDTAQYRVKVQYALRTGEGELRLREIELRLDSTAWVSTRPSVIGWKGRGITVDSLELRDARTAGRIFVNGEVPDADPGHLVVQLQGVRIAPWLAIVQSDMRAEGSLDLDAVWDGTRTDPKIGGTASLSGTILNESALPDTRARFDYHARRLELDVRALRGDSYELASLRGSVPLDLSMGDSVVDRLAGGELSLRLVGDSIPLQPLGELSEALADVRGTARGDVRVAGGWKSPTFDGALTASLPQLRLTSTGVMLRDVAAALRMSGDTMHVDTLVAHSGGTIRVTGDVLLASLTEPTVQLAINMRDARVLEDETGELFADGTVQVEGALDTLVVNGTVSITRGVVYIPEPAQYDIISTADPAIYAVTDSSTASALGIGGPSTMLRNLQMQVAVDVRRGTFARSADANVEVYGTLEVRKERGAEDYSISGALYTDQGTYSFLGKRFVVVRGAVRFLGTEQLNPVLQIIASYEVAQAGGSPLAIRVQIGGTLERPTISLESDAQPTLSQSDLISFLAFGRSSSSLLESPGTGLDGGGSGGLAGSVAALAQRQLAAIGLGALLDEVRGELVGATGADVLNITPAQLPANVTLSDFETVLRGTEIEIGKYVDRRTFIIGRIRPTLAVPGASVERRLTDRLRLRTSLETRLLPTRPSLSTGLEPRTLQVIGALLTWTIAW
ncbi:MAG: translocation/assembly module TamB domain-containing protein [Gemmatimonadota bacterium]